MQKSFERQVFNELSNSQLPQDKHGEFTNQTENQSINSLSNRLMSASLIQAPIASQNQALNSQQVILEQNSKFISQQNSKQETQIQNHNMIHQNDAQKILNEICVCINLSEVTIQRAKDVYIAYIKAKRQHLQLNTTKKIYCNKPLAMICAVFIASHFESSSQPSYSQTFRPITLTDIIQKNLLNIKDSLDPNYHHHEMEDFISTFKDVQTVLPIQSRSVKETLSKCLGLCQNFQTCLKIYNKFDQVWILIIESNMIENIMGKNTLVERNLKKKLWLFYLVCKHEILENDYLFDEKAIGTQMNDDFCQIQKRTFKQSSNLVDQAFLLIAVSQMFVADMNFSDSDEEKQLDASFLKMIENKIIASNQLGQDNDHQMTISNFKQKIENYMNKMTEKEREKMCRKRSASSVHHERLDEAFLDQNEECMNKEYGGKTGVRHQFDERYFANNSEKMKTPLKMVQSPFNARVGPMQRQTNGLIKNTCLQPPAAPSKRQLFPVFQNNDSSNQANNNRHSKNSTYEKYQRDSLEPPNKRQEVEAPIDNQAHQGNDQVYEESYRKQYLKEPSLKLNNSETQQSQYEKVNQNIGLANGQKQSQRILDFSETKQQTDNPTLQTKLNEVQFPNQCGQTPYINQMQKKFQQSVPCTPITEMMKLRNWFISKIKKTKLCFDESELPAKKLILSQKLLQILEMSNLQEEKEFNKNLTLICTGLIDKIIVGLARSKIEKNNQAHQHRKNQMKRSYNQIDSQKEQQVEIIREQLKQKHFDNIFGMTAQLLEKIFETHKEMGKVAEVKRLIKSEIFIKSIIICTTELQYFIYDVNDMQCCEVAELIGQPPFDFWRILSIFLKVYSDMPKRIALHFREIELRIISFLAWKKGSSVFKIVDFMKQQTSIQSKRNKIINTSNLNDQNENNFPELSERQKQKLVPYNCFFSRVLQASALTIVELCNMLKINAEYQEVIWSITKLLLSCEPNLLIDRHIDQLIMCTIYSVAKISDLRFVSFNSIINRYANLYENREFITQIYTHCIVNQETGEKKDIINFYNEVYLKKMKQYILLYRDQCSEIKQELILKSTTASQSQFTSGQCKALTPGNNEHILQNQSLLGIIKPQASAILTPIGTKMIIKAFCPTTALYDQLGQSKVNSSFRYVVNRGLNLSSSMTESSAEFQKQKMDNSINHQNQSTIDNFQNQPPKEDNHSFNKQNSINRFQTASGQINNQEYDEKLMKSSNQKNVCVQNTQTILNDNNCQPLSRKPPRPQPIPNQILNSNAQGIVRSETWSISNGQANKFDSNINFEQRFTQQNNIQQRPTVGINDQDKSNQSYQVLHQQIFDQKDSNGYENESKQDLEKIEKNLGKEIQENGLQNFGKTQNIGVDNQKIENRGSLISNGNPQINGQSSMRMNILKKIKKNCQNGAEFLDDSNKM